MHSYITCTYCIFYAFSFIFRLEKEQRIKNDDKPSEKGLKSFMKESAYGLIILLLIFGLFIGVLSLLLKLSQLNFITTRRIQQWSLINWFYCFGFSNQLWNMINIDHLRTSTIYEFLYTNNRNISNLTKNKLNKILYLDSMIKTKLYEEHNWRGMFIALYLNSSYVLQLLIQNPFQKHTALRYTYFAFCVHFVP